MTDRHIRLPLRHTSIAVLVVMVASTIALFVSIGRLVDGEQSRVLHDQAKEAGTAVESLFAVVGTSLPTLASDAPPATTSETQFVESARPYVGVALQYIGALELGANGTYRVVDSVGTGPGQGTVVAADRSKLAGSALLSDGVVHGQVATTGGPRMSFALKSGGGTVIVEDLSFDSTKPINITKSGPFSELNGALYASPFPDPGSLVLSTTSRIPLRGRPLSTLPVSIGKQHWLLVVSAKAPLIGAFAANAPWGVLAGGLALTVAVTLLVESIGRRRSYALELVDQRTRDLKEAREAAESANRAKSEFLSRMSHELRTPLNAILGFGQLLQLEDLTARQQESVDQILSGGRHLLDLINEVLDISRIESGQLSFSSEPVSVADAFSEVVALMRPLAYDRDIALIEEPGDPGASAAESAPPYGRDHVKADRQRLKQILLNLVSNAVKYSGPGSRVSLYCEHAGDRRLRIVVADEGPGIREEDHAKLFVPFERLGAEATGVEGTGVGLALSQRLAEAMGGTIGVSSAPGQGSKFWVELPLAEAPIETFEGMHVDKAAGVQLPVVGPRRTMLYIEDNLSNLRLVERVIGMAGDLELVAAMQGRLGIEMAKELRPAVILLDLHLPDMNGEEVLRELKRDPTTAGVPVVVLSADASPERTDRLLAGGTTAYLTKPLDVTMLIRVLRKQLDEVAPAASEPRAPIG